MPALFYGSDGITSCGGSSCDTGKRSGGPLSSLLFFPHDDERSPEELIVPESSREERLDVFLARSLGFSRNFVQGLIRAGNVQVDGVDKRKTSTGIHAGEKVTVRIPPPRSSDIVPENVPFDVIFEDQYIIVVNKPAGIVVHPAPGNWTGTLVHGLLYRYPDIGNIGNVLRPGIVHRLDEATSGLLVVARTQTALTELQTQFKERSVGKRYLTVVRGAFSSREGTIDLPIGRDPANRIRMAVTRDGKKAKTEFHVLWTRKNVSFLCVSIHSGRTHQIRVHMKEIEHPVLGDALYGGLRKENPGRLLLHSWTLSFIHPVSGKALSFRSPIPSDFISALRGLLSNTAD